MNDREKLVELLGKARVTRTDHSIIFHGDDAIADYLIAHGVTVQEWIPVTERLPDEKGEYLVAFHPCWWDDVQEDKTVVGTDTFRGKTTWAKKKFQRVTHWMPLPQPPKGE